jgi:hypothetical protein
MKSGPAEENVCGTWSLCHWSFFRETDGMKASNPPFSGPPIKPNAPLTSPSRPPASPFLAGVALGQIQRFQNHSFARRGEPGEHPSDLHSLTRLVRKPTAPPRSALANKSYPRVVGLRPPSPTRPRSKPATTGQSRERGTSRPAASQPAPPTQAHPTRSYASSLIFTPIGGRSRESKNPRLTAGAFLGRAQFLFLPCHGWSIMPHGAVNETKTRLPDSRQSMVRPTCAHAFSASICGCRS